MGIHHRDGYSATVEGFLVVGESRVRVAKSNECKFALAESCELAPGTPADLMVTVDGSTHTRRILLPQGIARGQVVVEYEVQLDPSVPF
jgi:hypothetical protein